MAAGLGLAAAAAALLIGSGSRPRPQRATPARAAPVASASTPDRRAGRRAEPRRAGADEPPGSPALFDERTGAPPPAAEQTDLVVVAEERTCVLRGQVTDPQGRGVVGAQVWVERLSSWSPPRTGPDGRFIARRLGPGAYLLVVEPPPEAGLARLQRPVRLERPGAVAEVELVLSPLAPVTVELPVGVAGQLAVLPTAPEALEQFAGQARGPRHELRLPPGRYEVAFWSDDRTAWGRADLEVGQAPLRVPLRLVGVGALAVRLVDGAGRRLPVRELQAEPLGFQPFDPRGATEVGFLSTRIPRRSGPWLEDAPRVVRLPPGRWEVRVSSAAEAGVCVAVEGVDMPADRDLEVTLEARPAREVLVAAPRSLADAELEVWGPFGLGLALRDEGGVAIGGLGREARATVWAWQGPDDVGRGERPWFGLCTLEPAVTSGHLVISEWAELSVRVLDRAGAPAGAGIEVSVEPDLPGEWASSPMVGAHRESALACSRETDPSGSARLDLPPGRWFLWVPAASDSDIVLDLAPGERREVVLRVP